MKYVGVQTFGGGLDLGLTQAGFELVGRREQLGGFGIPQCEANRALLGDAWDAEAGPPATWSMPDDELSLVASLPPCSGFSMMSVRAGSGDNRGDWRGVDAPVNSCMWATIEFAARANHGLGPPIVLFESVQGAGRDTAKGGLSLMRDLRSRLEYLTASQYDLYHVFHNAASVGGPSIRRRYFWVASRIPFGITSPQVTHVPTVREAIGDLDVNTDVWGPQNYALPANGWTADRRNFAGVVDGNMTYGETTGRAKAHYERVAGAFKYGWNQGEQLVSVAQRHYEETGEFPEGWDERTCDTALRGKFQGGAYQPRRWHADKAARVLAGNALTCVVHPWRDRTLTYREIARLMGFPDAWRLESYTTSGGDAVFGKAVTVDCGKWIGGHVRGALAGLPGKWTGTEIGERERVIDVSNDFKQAYSEKDGRAGDFRSPALVKEMAARPA